MQDLKTRRLQVQEIANTDTEFILVTQTQRYADGVPIENDQDLITKAYADQLFEAVTGSSPVFDNIADRDAADPEELGITFAIVRDASADPDVGEGSALYARDYDGDGNGTGWTLLFKSAPDAGSSMRKINPQQGPDGPEYVSIVWTEELAEAYPVGPFDLILYEITGGNQISKSANQQFTGPDAPAVGDLFTFYVGAAGNYQIRII